MNLDHSINVISKSKEIMKGDLNSSQYDISKIQLLSTSGVKFINHENKKVRLTGIFFRGHTGGHHTEVLMDVKEITNYKY